MRKILSLILTLAMIIGACIPFAQVHADEPSVSVLFPANGATIGNEQCEILVATSSAGERLYELDGKITYSPVLTTEMLTIGDHELCVYVISENGEVASAKSEFSVQKNINDVRISTDLSSAATATLTDAISYLYSSDSGNTTAVRMVRQETSDWPAVLSIVDGPDGNGDVAVKASSTSTGTSIWKSFPYFDILYASKTIKTIAVIEHDVMMADDTNTVLRYELKASNNASWYPVSTDVHPMSGGKFFNSSYTYQVNKWYHIKTVLDFGTRKVNVYVTDHDTDTEMHVLSNQPMMASGIDLTSIRCAYSSNVKNGGFAIDNISVREQPQFTGINAVKYFYGEELSGDISPDAAKLTSLGITLNEKITATDLSGLVEIISKDGIAAELSSVTLDAASNMVIAKLASALDANSEYSVRAGLGAVYSGASSLATDIMETQFKTAAKPYDVNYVNFTVTGQKLIKKEQLLGKKLKCKVSICNSGNADETLSVILAVRNGDRLCGLSLQNKNITVPAGESNYVVEPETAILPQNLEDVTIQVMLVDALSTRKPVFSTYEIKY